MATRHLLPGDPLDYDERNAHNHEDETQCHKCNRLDLWPFQQRFQRLLFFRDDVNVEYSRKNKNEAGSRCGTDEAEDVTNVGHKDDEQVD